MTQTKEWQLHWRSFVKLIKLDHDQRSLLGLFSHLLLVCLQYIWNKCAHGNNWEVKCRLLKKATQNTRLLLIRLNGLTKSKRACSERQSFHFFFLFHSSFSSYLMFVSSWAWEDIRVSVTSTFTVFNVDDSNEQILRGLPYYFPWVAFHIGLSKSKLWLLQTWFILLMFSSPAHTLSSSNHYLSRWTMTHTIILFAII